MIGNYCVIDTENSGALRNKAHPFDPRNKICLVGLRSGSWSAIFDIEYSIHPYADNLRAIGEHLSKYNLLVGFNLKYDLHWLRRYNIPIDGIKVWDCQLAEFVLSNQTNQYPSLGESCTLRGLAQKKDTLQEYLDIGLDVSDIPLPELTEYLEGDLRSTEELFLIQEKLLKDAGLYNLFRLQCQDLVVLADMEYNGIKYDIDQSLQLAKECSDEERKISESLSQYLPVEIAAHFNWNSGDHLSALLYGGNIRFDYKVPNGTYKSGIKVGQVKYSWRYIDYDFPRLVEPLKGSELKKDGFFGTSEDVLKGLKAKGKAKQIIDASLRLSELSKLRGTYYEGIPNKFEEYGWEDNLVHGQLNQCVAVTGRLSSSNPNLQNNPSESKECFVSRYAN